MLSDEEKKELDNIKESPTYREVILLRAIEKQQKEIELLKEENEKYKNPPFFDEDEYTENDKIKAKIEEIDEVLKGQLIEKIRVYFEAQKEVLQSLLEKE